MGIITGSDGERILKDFKGNRRNLLTVPMRMNGVLSLFTLSGTIGKIRIYLNARTEGVFMSITRIDGGLEIQDKVESWEDAEDLLAENLTLSATKERAVRYPQG